MRRVGMHVAASCLIAVALVGVDPLPCRAAAARPAPSTYITDVRMGISTLRRLADESDKFHLTWHADGALYGAYGDGWGFVRSDIPKRAAARRSGWDWPDNQDDGQGWCRNAGRA